MQNHHKLSHAALGLFALLSLGFVSAILLSPTSVFQFLPRMGQPELVAALVRWLIKRVYAASRLQGAPQRPRPTNAVRSRKLRKLIAQILSTTWIIRISRPRWRRST